MRRLVAFIVCLPALLLAFGCAEAADEPDTVASANGAPYELPPAGGMDYQLGGTYPPPEGTAVVVRDSSAPPADGVYSICYVNGFQSQPGEAEAWGELLLEDEQGPLADPDWPDEFLLDTSTAASRAAIVERQRSVVEQCADSGYDAVEFDNLDSYLRSEGRLESDDNLELARALIEVAHEAGLAAGQKNSPELALDGAAAGFDFAVTEECGAFDECAIYAEAYDVVLNIEYVDEREFDDLCASGALPPQSVRRDLQLTTPGSSSYVFQWCA